ncbi:hypothetical protein R3P38DRAFT_2521408 [Favolaschia claudopus]|uniref:Uncharacterized protein n=1 Tax=Favolaschia claudopus TaxID=2862362 RepID=A0AAW0C4I4_9AGAR
MSELDSLSDTEWLEISSNQSDNDSLSDSSRSSDLPSEPPSRRSSISIDSSLDGQIDAWEGFADDSPEDLVLDADPMIATVLAEEHAGSPRLAENPDRVSEEQLVNAALEQSLVGTLSASRSSSFGGPPTVHNSLRDLRLSFPDPITSSRDELNRSYEAVSSSETHCITDDVSNSPMTTDGPEDEPPIQQISPPGEIDPQPRDKLERISGSDSLPTLVCWWDGRQIKDFDLVLYGSTSQSRDFAQWLLSILATAGVELSHIQQFHHSLSEKVSGDTAVPSSQNLDRPSLAIVSLPASFEQLPPHTVYLPVVFPLSDDPISLDSSIGNWSRLNNPPVRLLRLTPRSESQVFADSVKTRNMVDPQFVHKELMGQLSTGNTKKPLVLERAVTFVGLLLIVMGFTVNSFFRLPTPTPTPAAAPLYPTQTTVSTLWNVFGATPNSSETPVSTALPTGNLALMPSTLKELALAVLNPATTTPCVEPASVSVAPVSSSACDVERNSKTRADRERSTKEVMIRPPTSLSNSPSAKPHSPTIGKLSPLPVDESAPVTALSLKFVDSLSEVADATMKALEQVVGPDFREVMMAIDSLIRAIGRQAEAIVADSKSRAQILRNLLKYRNQRAKGKARELQQTAEKYVSAASERLKARAEIARTRAQVIKKGLMTSSAWRAYAQAHGHWVEKLEVKRARRKERRERDGTSLFRKIKERRALRASKKRAN